MTTTKALSQTYKALKDLERMRHNLPHIYGYKWYQWALDFQRTKNRTKFLVAGNQLSKSSTQIRHVIDLATDPSKWGEYWDLSKGDPQVFWYVYPSKSTATKEFTHKWVKEFLPRNEMKEHELYGWKATYNDKKEIEKVEFNTGVTIYFPTWAQQLQSSTIHYCAIDEEIPYKIWPELVMRVSHYDGIISMVFTSTLGEREWFKAMELMGKKGETFTDAWKMRVTVDDCRFYADGSPTHINDEWIAKKKAQLGSKNEILRRLYGRFIMATEGLQYPTYKPEIHRIAPFPIPKDYLVFSGVDIGSGGKAHPAAISFIAVRPDMKLAIVFKHWRGDPENIPGPDKNTTSKDILVQYQKMRGSLEMAGEYYDWQSKDFHTFAAREGESFEMAEKGQDYGKELLNAAFKNKMLYIFDLPETEPLHDELTTLREGVKKSKAKDDSIDSMRFGFSRVEMDMSDVKEGITADITDVMEKATRKTTRHAPPDPEDDDDAFGVEEEIAYFNDFMESY